MPIQVDYIKVLDRAHSTGKRACNQRVPCHIRLLVLTLAKIILVAAFIDLVVSHAQGLAVVVTMPPDALGCHGLVSWSFL